MKHRFPLPPKYSAWAPALVLAGVMVFDAARATPHVPDDDATVLEHLPIPADATRRALRRLRAELDENPQDLRLAVRLARRYVETARAEADPRYAGYAQAALAPWWDLARPPRDVLILRATLLQNRHAFDAALADLSRALSIDPRNAQAWLTHSVILQVQGRNREAIASCRHLAGMADAVVVAACASGAAGRNGRALAAYRRLSKALADAGDTPPTLKLWALTVLGEIAASLGRHEDAERHFLEALSLETRDVYLLGAYADFLLDRDRPREVRDLLADETRIDGLLLRLALAAQRLNAEGASRYAGVLSARYAASRQRGESVHARDEARFRLHLLGDPAAALAIARDNWRVQREPWDARLVLESALAAGEPAGAAEVIAWLEETGLEDVRITALAERLDAIAR